MLAAAVGVAPSAGIDAHLPQGTDSDEDRGLGSHRVHQRGDVIGAAPGQRDAGAPVPIAVHDGAVVDPLRLEPHGRPDGTQPHPMTDDRRPVQLGHDRTGPGKDQVRDRGIGTRFVGTLVGGVDVLEGGGSRLTPATCMPPLCAKALRPRRAGWGPA